MTRPIKFRAWDEGNKVMHHDFQFIKSGDEGNDWIIFISDKRPLSDHKTNPFTNPSPYFSRQLKVMQFTGLHDKNGNEIWEGDILKTCVEMPGFGQPNIFKNEIVIFNLNTGSFGLVEKLPAEEYIPFSWIFKTDWKHGLEVLGNVHENSELLK